MSCNSQNPLETNKILALTNEMWFFWMDHLLKHVELRKNPSLEFGMMLVFTYLPYALAEGIHLSGIMAILFCGIVMSHYTHYNLSPITQITMRQTMRTIAFTAGEFISTSINFKQSGIRNAHHANKRPTTRSFEMIMMRWLKSLDIVTRSTGAELS